MLVNELPPQKTMGLNNRPVDDTVFQAAQGGLARQRLIPSNSTLQ